ncbi:MAG: MBL fold metallo-hydrolase, partial [Alphaproteobacteria bacterium]|nr:MBL fold metallo-hydrolase [Alphaproteobacteria bacterium]
RPVTVLLSHCHHDHCGNLDRIEAPVTVMAHWAAAKALAEGDRMLTQIDLLPGAAPPRRAVDVRLFLPGGAAGVGRRLRTPAGIWSGLDFDLGGSEPLRVLKTPGHSPCGLEINFQRIKKNRRIKVMTMTSVAGVEGTRGDYSVTVTT